MRRLILYITFCLVFFLSDYQLAFAQFSSGEWMSDKPFQYMTNGMGSISGSTRSYSSSRSRSEKAGRNNDYETRTEEANREALEAEMRAARANRRAAEAERKAAEAERILKEKEFLISKDDLLHSLRGGESNRPSSSKYGKGLRGLSDYQDSGDGQTSYSSGLRGFQEESDERGGYSTEKHDDAIRNRGLSPKNDTRHSVSNDFSRRNEYIYQYELVNVPELVYYSPNAYFVMGTSESQDDPWLDRFEQQIDVWRETGEHKVLSYVGDKLIGFARKTVSRSSAMGAQIVRVYGIVNDIAGVKNLEMNIINRNLGAVRSAIKTGNPRSVNEANQKAQQEVIDHRNTYMANKNLISPSPKQIDKKGQAVTKGVTETASEKWIQSKIIKH